MHVAFETANVIHCYRFFLFLLYSSVLGWLLIASLVGAADLFSATGKGGAAWNAKKAWSSKSCTQKNGDTTWSNANATDNAIICGDDKITVNKGASVAAASVTIQSGGELDNGDGATLSVSGNFTNNGTFTANQGTVVFNGSTDQTINGTSTSTVFNNLTINKTLGKILLGDLSNASHNITVSNALTLTSGLVQTAGGSASNYIYLANSADAASGSTSSYINGNVRRRIATGNSTLNWPIGTANSYAPLSVTFSGVTVAGDLQASTTIGDSSSIASAQLNAAKSVNRVWSLSSFNGLTYASLSPTFTFLSSDVDIGSDLSAIVAGRYNASLWYYPEIGTRLNTSTQITGLTAADGLGDFQLAMPAPAPYSNWRMNQLAWNGTLGEVRDQGSANPPSGYPASARGTADKRPTTSRAAPALVGSPGTCNSGVFRRTDQQYLALPGYPNLGVDAGVTSFTITGWVRTTDATLSSQRILVADNGLNAGWGFGIDNSQLAFFSRTSSPVNFALNSWGVSNNTWYFVVAVHDAVNKVRKIYSYSASGVLNGSAIEATPYTGNFSANAGDASIGGQAGTAGFAGNLDEVKVFNAALSAAMLDSVRRMTNICPGARLNRYVYQREQF